MLRRISRLTLFASLISVAPLGVWGQESSSEVTQVCRWWHFGQRNCCREHAVYGTPTESGTLTTPGDLSTPSDLSDPTAPSTPSEDLLGAQVGALPSSTIALADTNGGYIDSAIPRTRLRMRFDAAYDNNRPDRAEYFYAKCGCFRNPALPAGVFDPDAEGPTTRDFRPESSLDYQDIETQLEIALNGWISGFVEVPFRFLNPVVNDNTSGFADMRAGFKIALISNCDKYVTFQLRTYIPTGDSRSGLGTDHVSLEPAILYYQQLSPRLQL